MFAGMEVVICGGWECLVDEMLVWYQISGNVRVQECLFVVVRTHITGWDAPRVLSVNSCTAEDSDSCCRVGRLYGVDRLL